MSWILGFTGTSLSPTLRERLVALHGAARFKTRSETLYLAVGGLAETCCYAGLHQTSFDGFAVVGLGIRLHERHCTFLDTEDWRALITRPRPALDALDGHFVAVRWQPGKVACFTDALGIRTLYLTRLSGGVAFSTRLDWLAALRNDAEINFETFGTHWLTFNQLSTDSLVSGIQRMGPGSRATCTDGDFQLINHPWTPDTGESDRRGEAFSKILAALVHPKTADGRTLSLGLSGGLDSRLLLALRPSDAPIQTHVFGPDEHPDVRVSKRIAEGEGLQHVHFHAPTPEADECLDLLRNHVAQTHAVSSASSLLGLRYYPDLHAQHRLMIDGGFGEAARRQFMNRLLRQGRSALRTGHPAAILPHIRVPRADVFTPETTATMERGARQQIAALWQTLPDPQTIGEDSFLDLLGLRTRLPNFFGFEQNRLDGLILNYMPFAQPSLLRAVFQIPVSLRRGGRLFRRLIRSREESLARYPLVKNGISYPFRLSTLPAHAWTSLKKRLGHGYRDQQRLDFLEQVRTYALDAVHSTSVRTYPAFDHRQLVQLVEGYYNGRRELAAQVDWWLAFDMWRRVIGAT